MKKVAGKLKLNMAQFRELEAFAQFASDLDPETKKQIDRGQRITELLKQPQFSPMAVEEQVALIYAVNNGYFDQVEVKNVKEAETKFVNFINKTKRKLLDQIVGGEWDEKVEGELKSACEEFSTLSSRTKS
jgi:F0F1-type ATP synthase alpha subunit